MTAAAHARPGPLGIGRLGIGRLGIRRLGIWHLRVWGAALLLLTAVLVAVLWPPRAPARAQGSPLVVDLSDHLVAITTGFAGTEVLLFGAIDEAGDVVVVVRGPNETAVMHRKSRIAGIWANAATMTFEDVPSFYAVASSRGIEDIAGEAVLARNKIGVHHLITLPRAKASANIAKEWTDALIRNKARENLYASEVGKVTFLGNQLFRTRVFFPANVPTGTYQVQAYLLREGAVVSAQTSPLIVGKVGAEAEIYDFAHNQSALYGVIAILIALVAGWLAHVAFRKA